MLLYSPCAFSVRAKRLSETGEVFYIMFCVQTVTLPIQPISQYNLFYKFIVLLIYENYLLICVNDTEND